ncbi:secreted RxLR effector protein 161-like [Pistacia vera]|uniref:secreted RxLR effector protein 161-like n=1 Tax=Pistacia vera TaxID=55513 RepID=UPI0012632C59|nr:secreted RxLR effector protein 161-like [Pistacia vera]
MLKSFGLDNAKHAKTPMSTTLKLTKTDEHGKKVHTKVYRSMIGSLLYLTARRLDICASVGICPRYQANPSKLHMIAVKRIMKYISSTSDFSLWFSYDSNTALVGYSDVDWAGNIDDRKSTSKGCFYLGNNLVTWYSKKQDSISLSTVEAEYIAIRSCYT